jgi:phosphopantetheinyl transferase (holo-ACP synthase)
VLLEQEQDRCANVEKCNGRLQQRFDAQEELYRALGCEGNQLKSDLQIVKQHLGEEREKVKEAEGKYKVLSR